MQIMVGVDCTSLVRFYLVSLGSFNSANVVVFDGEALAGFDWQALVCFNYANVDRF